MPDKTRPSLPNVSAETYRQERAARPRTSLDHVQGKAPTSPAQIRAMAAKAAEIGVVMFLREDLKRLPWAAREIIEAEHNRLYGRAGQ